MKKIMSILLSVTMLLAGGLALAEDTTAETVEPIVGAIVEMREDGSFILEELNENRTQVDVRVHEGTEYEADWALGEGDIVIVQYDGRMTHSLPGQINADSIRSYTLEGFVSEVDAENNKVLLNSHANGPVWVTLPEGEKAEDYMDQVVRVYYAGIMAMSYPPQAGAYSIQIVHAVTGKVTEIGDGYFLMDWGESSLHVHFDDHTKVADSFDVGDAVQVYYNGIMTRSMPGQITAMVVVKVEVTE